MCDFTFTTDSQPPPPLCGRRSSFYENGQKIVMEMRFLNQCIGIAMGYLSCNILTIFNSKVFQLNKLKCNYTSFSKYLVLGNT